MITTFLGEMFSNTETWLWKAVLLLFFSPISLFLITVIIIKIPHNKKRNKELEEVHDDRVDSR